MADPGAGRSRRASRVFGVFERLLEPVTTRYATVGSDLADRYVALGIPQDKIRAVRSGVDVGRQPAPAAACHRGAERYGLPEDRPLVMSISSLESRNGTWRLPELGLTVAGGRAPSGSWVVAGSGPLDVPLRRRLEEAGLASDNAVIGHVEDERDLVAAADARRCRGPLPGRRPAGGAGARRGRRRPVRVLRHRRGRGAVGDGRRGDPRPGR